jgi:hypothetical protein
MSVVAATADTAIPIPAAERGTLTIKPRVVTRLAMRALRTRTSAERDPSVDVTHFGDDHVELEARITLPYPDEPIGAVLDRLREQVARDVALALGRPVRSIDLTVDKFGTAQRRRVQ